MFQRKLNTKKSEDNFFSKNKLKFSLLGLLLLITVILLIFYFSDNGSKNQNVSLLNSQLTVEKISSDFDSIMFSFGIEKSWVKEIKSVPKNIGKDNLLIGKDVRIPNDMLTIELNYELSNYFNENNLASSVVEDPRTKNISISIYKKDDSLKKITGLINFIYSDSIKRKASDVCLLIDSIESNTTDDAGYILRSSENLSVFLPLRNDKIEYQSLIMGSGKNYLIELSAGGENDLVADFQENMKESAWKSKVKSVIQNFPGVSGIFLKSNSAYDEFSDKIKQEFETNGVRIYRDSLFYSFYSKDSITARLFNSIKNKSAGGIRIQFYKLKFTLADFKEFESKVYVLKKSGYRFLSFRQITNRL